MVERALRDVVVVGLAVSRESRLQLGARLESGLLHHLADASIEALHQAVCLRMAPPSVVDFDLPLWARRSHKNPNEFKP